MSARRTQAVALREQGLGYGAIAKQMGVSVSRVRQLLDPDRYKLKARERHARWREANREHVKEYRREYDLRKKGS